ncbi:MAG: serine hydrolase domain-containing protein [Blastomonas sp.]
MTWLEQWAAASPIAGGSKYLKRDKPMPRNSGFPVTISAFAVAVGACAQSTAFAQADSNTVSERQSDAQASARSVRDRRIEDFAAAFSSGDAQKYREWLLENRTPASLAGATMEQRLEQYRLDFEEHGRLTIVSLRLAGSNTIEADSETSNGGTITFVFGFDPQSPFQVSSLNFRIGGPPRMNVQLSAQWTSLDALADEAREAVGVPALAIGVYRSGTFETAISGHTIAGGSEEARVDDPFHWGSVGKSVTGTVLGALIDRGEMNWDTTIGEVFGDAPIRPEYRPVKLWQLMSHQAGVPVYTLFDEAFGQRIRSLPGSTDADKRAAFVIEMLQEPPTFSPGEGVEYSNGGITVAGRMAEIVSGRTWEQLVQEYVFDAAGMRTAGFGLPTNPEHPEGIRGHFPAGPGQFAALPLDGEILKPDVIAPAGGVHSSIGDMLRFGVMHLNGMNGQDGVISSETMRALHTPRPGQPPSFGESYTFGWGARCPFEAPAGVRCQGHNGGGGAYYAQIVLLPDQDMVIAMMASNTMAGEAVSREVFQKVVDHYLGSPG